MNMAKGEVVSMVTWDERGNLTSELSYLQGKRHGVVLEWYADGGKRAEWLYENGVLISVRSWDETGQLLNQ